MFWFFAYSECIRNYADLQNSDQLALTKLFGLPLLHFRNILFGIDAKGGNRKHWNQLLNICLLKLDPYNLSMIDTIDIEVQNTTNIGNPHHSSFLSEF